MSKAESEENVVTEEQKEEEENYSQPDCVTLCKCLKDISSEKVVISARKQAILNTAATVESFIRERRIPEFFHFLLAKLLADLPDKPILYFEKLLDDCMLFRAGNGNAPVLFDDKHLQAVIRSFDPGDRGWLTAGQVRRLYTTLNISVEKKIEERVKTSVVFQRLKEDQEKQLYKLLTAGMAYYQNDYDLDIDSNKSEGSQ